jgi:hypothetical protein
MQNGLIQVMSAPGGGYEARLEPNWDGFTPPGADAPHVAIPALPAVPEGFEDWASFVLRTDGASPHFDTLGRALHDLLITGEIRRALYQVNEPLRLFLKVEPEELDMVPWEFMRDGPMLTFTDVSRPVSRVAASYNPGLKLAPMSWPLRVVLVVGSKDKLIRVDEEIKYVTDGFRRVCGLVDLKVLRLPGRDDIRDICQTVQPHVFHFIGHGRHDERRGGYLKLEQENGAATEWWPTEIRDDLRPAADAIRLAVLNACQSGQPGNHIGTRAAMQGLAALNVPAIIAMQGPIRGESAARFAKGLYEALSRGVPLDKAVAEARVRITVVAAENQRDYALPSLILRAPPERILDLSHGDPGTTLEGRPPLSAMLSFVDRTDIRRQLWERLQPDQAAGPRVFAVTGPPRTGKGSLVRWCLGVALVEGYPVAFADLSNDRIVDSVVFLHRLVDAVAAGGADRIQSELNGFGTALDAYEADRSTANAQHREFSTNPVYLYEKLSDVLAKAERTLVVGIDGLVRLELGAWLNQAVPGFVQRVARGQLSNVRLIMALPDTECATHFLPKDFADGEIKYIPLQVFKPPSFVRLASQRMRAQDYPYESFSPTVENMNATVQKLGYWDTEPFELLDSHARWEHWAKGDEDSVIRRP